MMGQGGRKGKERGGDEEGNRMVVGRGWWW